MLRLLTKLRPQFRYRSVAVVSSRLELARLSHSLLAALCGDFFGWAHLVTTDANTEDRGCRKSRRSDRTTNFTKSQKTSLIPTSRGIPGVWTLSGKLKTRVFILSQTLPRCQPSSRNRRCFVFPTELAAAFARMPFGKASRCRHYSGR